MAAGRPGPLGLGCLLDISTIIILDVMSELTMESFKDIYIYIIDINLYNGISI